MPLLTRRRLLVAGPLVVLLLAAVTVFLYARADDLKSRSARIVVGTPREEVESVLGPPYLLMGRSGDRGEALIWVDQFWQVNVYTDPTGRVESVACGPSDSAYRRTVGRLIGGP